MHNVCIKSDRSVLNTCHNEILEEIKRLLLDKWYKSKRFQTLEVTGLVMWKVCTKVG